MSSLIANLVVNKIPGIESMSYLELGYGNGHNFAGVIAREKISVDTNGQVTYTGTTDEFFYGLSGDKSWDIIYVDANHDFRQVVRDFNHSVKHCRRWVLLHDMIPPSEKYTQPHLCSDAYKLLACLLKGGKRKVFPTNERYGLTLVRMPTTQVMPKLYNEFAHLSYDDFMKIIAETYIYNQDEITGLLTGRLRAS